jgi:putative hemolysin
MKWQREIVGFFVMIIAAAPRPAAAMLNPAAVYCRSLGYQYYSAQTPRGVVGMCQLPNGDFVDAWEFYRGKTALNWSYCAKQGYQAKRDESGQICRDCLVCVLPDGREVHAGQLMHLNFRESPCGDLKCGTMENTANCPSDCPSGGADDYCDGLRDRRCDPDCVLIGGADRDCPGLQVEIAPGLCPKPENVKDSKALTIAILGTGSLDVTRIKPKSIKLSRSGVKRRLTPAAWHVKDVATPRLADACGCWLVPGDKRPDLVLEFGVQKMSRKLALLNARPKKTYLTVSAELDDGTKLKGRGCIDAKFRGKARTRRR